jgi:hypothetical protein
MGNPYWSYRDGFVVFTPLVGGWVKIVRGHTVINGFIVGITDTHIEVDGIPPLPLNEWPIIICKPPEGAIPRLREQVKDGSNGQTA